MEEHSNPNTENQEKSNLKRPFNSLPRLEILIIVVFFGSFLIWTANRCSTTRKKFQEIERQAQLDDSLYNADITFEAVQEPTQATEPTEQAEATASPTVTTITEKEKYTPLYVTLPNLNMRDRPNLQGRVLTRLKLHDEVEFLNEVTEFTQEINLGDTTTIAPWVKVKSKDGSLGWVYGAGVYYYKITLLPDPN